jgi:O-antigen/teichoic acid export membrane protein
LFIRDVFYTFSTEIFSIGANFLVGVLLARALTVTERGIMVLVMTLPWTVFRLASLGLPQANIYLVGRKKRETRIVLGNALTLALGLGLLSVVILSALKGGALRTVLKGLSPAYWWPLILLIPMLLVDGMTLSILRACQRFDLFNLRRLASPILLLLGFVVALIACKGGLTTAVGAYVAVTALTTVLGLALAGREVALRPTYDQALTKEALQFGLKSYIQNLVGSLNYRLDIYLLALFLTPEQIAFYGVATSLAEVAWYIPNSVGMVLFPRLSNAPVEQVHQITARVCRNTLTITVLVVVGMLAAGWFLVPLVYGPAYRATVPPLLILLPGVMSMGLYKVLTRNFTSRNQQQVSILASSVALALNFGLDWLLIPRWSVVGAAVASTAAYTAAGVALVVFFLHDSQLSWQEVLLPTWDELLGHWHWTKASFQNLWHKAGI